MSINKIPPHSIEAERGVLGSILIDAESLTQVADVVVPDDFYDPRHAVIFRAMVDLFTKGRAIDLLTMREILDDRKELETVGGNVYLVDLTNAVFTSSNVYQYAQIVKSKSILRKLIKAGNDIIMYGYDEASDLTKLLERSEQALFHVTHTIVQNRLVHIREILSGRADEIAEIHANPGHIDANLVPTGFASLDRRIGGFKRGDMVILAARPSMGKTALALNILQNITKKGWKTGAVFSLEMTKEQLTDRLICASLGVDSWKIQKGQLTDDEYMGISDAINDLSQSHIYMDDSPAGNLMEIKSKSRRLKMERGLDFIVIDYLQLMNAGNPNNRVQEISEISRGIKALARELQVPVLALSQLSRAVESRMTKEPVLSDLRESGSIEQDADIVLMLYREDYYDPLTENKGITSVFIRKNRNGPVGQVNFKFESKYMKFYDIAGEGEFGNYE